VVTMAQRLILSMHSMELAKQTGGAGRRSLAPSFHLMPHAALIVVESAVVDFLARIPEWVWICLGICVIGLRFAYSFLAKHPR
jgi:hypothetical protein